jgi:histidyl-tRNA synthetase
MPKKEPKEQEKAPNPEDFQPDEVETWKALMASAPPKPKGKPTPEIQAQMKEQKVKEQTFLATVSARLGLAAGPAFKKALTAAVEMAGDSSVSADHLMPPSGTRDFFPEEMRVRNWMFGNMRKVARSFGFQEYDAPVLESVALYERKAGEEITEQMYNFIDKEGNGVTLRPEMTPSLARMILRRTNLADGTVKDTLPVKWFSIPQCWRFETTQRGRKREHYQWNVDIAGVTDITAELEVLAAAVEFFKSVDIGPEIVGFKINSRKVLESLLYQLGIKKTKERDLFAEVCVVIDKLDKIGADGVKEELSRIGVDENTANRILAAMASKSIDELASLCEGVDPESVNEMRRLFDLADSYGIKDYLIFDASVVRGLAYYTGIVFECFDRRGELRAICGGGRYDRLLSLYGSPKDEQTGDYKWTIPCVGFGFGDCVIMELLNDLNKVAAPARNVDYLVAAYKPEMYGAATRVAAALRNTGASVDLYPLDKKPRWVFDYANKVGAARVAYIAPNEWSQGKVRFKDMATKEGEGEGEKQVDVPIEQLDNVDSFFGGAGSSSLSGAAAQELARAKARIAELTKRVEALE